MLGKDVKIIIPMMLVLLTLSSAQAMDIGTVIKRNELSAKPGQIVEFTILFWNLDNRTYPIRFDLKEAPKDWEVAVKPEILYLGPSAKEGEEFISLPQGMFSAEPVKVFVKIPASAQEGRNEIYVTSTFGEGGEGISVMQERTFKLVAIIGRQRGKTVFETIREGIRNLIDSLSENAERAMTGMAGLFAGSPTALTVLLSIIILAASWLVYKKYE